MILKNKKLLIVTSLLTLLPIAVGLVLWNRFPETIAIHFGITGQADGFASVPFAVFGLPLMMLAIHWLCIIFTALDKGNKNRNQKPLSVVLWIIPLLCNLSCCGIYAFALGVEFSPVAWTMVPMGIMFAAIGNYLPKTRMNATMGIKIPWTYSSEANWNATHRFAGKFWVIGGILIAFCGFLPYLWAVCIMFSLIMILVLVPLVYSYRFYRKELALGKELSRDYPYSSKKVRKISAVLLVVLAVFLLVVLFYGDIDFHFREDYLLVDTNMYSDNVVYYDAIESIEYREGNVSGLRVGGYGSFRLLMGYFQNEEFGTYMRYTYYKPEACVVLQVSGKPVVLSAENADSTRNLYKELLQYTAK